MCGRYDNLIPRDAYAGLFRAARIPRSNFPPRYNIAPTDQIPIIRVDPYYGERELVMASWVGGMSGKGEGGFPERSVVLGRLRLRPAGTVKPKYLSYMSYQRSIYVLPLDDPPVASPYRARRDDLQGHEARKGRHSLHQGVLAAGSRAWQGASDCRSCGIDGS